MATEPFSAEEDLEAFTNVLRSLLLYYENVTSVEMGHASSSGTTPTR